jgi:antitoxin FitA
MSTLTIRNLDNDVKQRLRKCAAARGVSMEQGARQVLLATTSVRPRKQGEWRLKASLEEILALGCKPERPFDLKAASDEMWDEGMR